MTWLKGGEASSGWSVVVWTREWQAQGAVVCWLGRREYVCGLGDKVIEVLFLPTGKLEG